MNTLLTTRQLQDLLQVDRITIYRMLNDGRLQGFKVGGQWRFSRQSIDDWLQQQQADLDVAGPPQGADDLQPAPEALPLSCIQAIQDVFSEALGVGTVTTSVDGTPITPISNCHEFCTLILGTNTGRQRCIASWRAAAAKQGDAPQLATCHAGLCYVWGRIEVHGKFVAAIHAGQFLAEPPDAKVWSVVIRDLSAATGIDEEKLQKAAANLPVPDEGRRQQIPHLVERVAGTFSEIGEERLYLLGRLQRIAEISSL